MRTAICVAFLVTALLSGCHVKDPLTYYRGYIPDYRQAADGRYYPVDEYGRFMALSMDYRQGNDGTYYCPGSFEGHNHETVICDYGKKQSAPRKAAAPESDYDRLLAAAKGKTLSPVPPVPVPAPIPPVNSQTNYYCDNDICYALPFTAPPGAANDNDTMYMLPRESEAERQQKAYRTFWDLI